MTGIQNKLQESFLNISNNIFLEMSLIEKANEDKWQQISILSASESANATRIINSNLAAFDSQISKNVFEFMSNNVSNMNTQLIEVQKNFNARADAALASSLMVQAQNRQMKDIHSKQASFHDYIVSASYFLLAGDEDNAIGALKGLNDNSAFELYLDSITKEEYKVMEAFDPIDDTLKLLINQLGSLNSHGRYSDDLKTLRYCSNMIDEKLTK